MDKSLERNKLSKSIQEELDNLNSSTSIKYIELVVKNLPKKKIPEPDSFNGEFTQYLKKK